MEVNVFYSWQSDLPNNKNRGFIQDCIEKAVKQITKEKVHLEIAVDRDTKGISGTPDIASSIFSKIDNSTIFIADISIINSQSTDRKTPNPNVLIELGYAAKTLGWSNIISIFNTEFGKVEELPFDLRFRRPLTYKIENQKNKTADRVKLIDIIKSELTSIIHKQQSKDEIRQYIKQQIDKEILTICNQLFKVFYGYDKQYTLDSIWQMLNFTEEEIQRELFERRFLGFTVLKDWKLSMQKLQDAMNQPFFTQNAEPAFVSSLIKVIRGLETMAVVFSNEKLFRDSNKTANEYRVVDGYKMNSDNPKDSYLLTKKLADTEEEVVVDFGTIRKFNLKRTNTIMTINGEMFLSVTMSIRELLQGIDAWTSATGNQLIVDPLTFRI
jgi:hypothetical protein